MISFFPMDEDKNPGFLLIIFCIKLSVLELQGKCIKQIAYNQVLQAPIYGFKRFMSYNMLKQA